MQKIATCEMYPDYSTIRIWDASVDKGETYHQVTAQTLAQGFSRRSGSYNFSTLADCMGLTIEVWLADELDEIYLRPDTVRAIMVPFLVSGCGIMIGNIMQSVEMLVPMTRSSYALTFEVKLRNDQEYLKSPEYLENVECGFTQEWCYLTFYPRAEPVQPQILRVDAWSCPPYDLQGYCPLKPTYPLLMEVGLA